MSSITGKYKIPRREDRFPVRIPVTLRIGEQSLEYLTGDVSYRGLFVCTDSPPVLRQLIRIEAVLPPDDTKFMSHGMSVFTLHPDNNDERMPGVGIQYYAQSMSNRRTWETFVDYARSAPPELPEGTLDPIHRLHPRVDARFEVRPNDLEELKTIYSRDISKGGMFLETDMQVELGITLALTIFHPLTRRAFTIESTVKRHSSSPRGVGVEFENLSDSRRAAFDSFVNEGLVTMGIPASLKSKTDPNS